MQPSNLPADQRAIASPGIVAAISQQTDPQDYQFVVLRIAPTVEIGKDTNADSLLASPW